MCVYTISHATYDFTYIYNCMCVQGPLNTYFFHSHRLNFSPMQTLMHIVTVVGAAGTLRLD